MSSTLLIGGARSGKTAWAVRFGNRFEKKTYIATAAASDDEMKDRIARHRAERGDGWRTVEEEVDLPAALLESVASSNCIVVDCLTVWTATMMFRESSDEQIIKEHVEPLVRVLSEISCPVLFITNEVGMGVVPEYESGRRYRDLLGWINQRMAQACDNVVLFTAGIPLAIKGVIPE